MAIFFAKIKSRWIILIASACAFLLLFNAVSNKGGNSVDGWKTIQQTQQPFGPGVITDGQIPRNLEVQLDEPKNHSPIEAEPLSVCQLMVSIKWQEDVENINHAPPTFVSVLIIDSSKHKTKFFLLPARKEKLLYIYSAQVDVPEKLGDYDVVVEAEYVFSTKGSIDGKHPQSYRQTSKVASLHVRN